MNSHGEESNPPDISFINRHLDGLAEWLTENTPWKFSSMQAGIIVLISGLGIGGTVRLYRARRVWQHNMDQKSTVEQQTEARFDALRRGGEHEHHIEPTIPHSPEVIIQRKK